MVDAVAHRGPDGQGAYCDGPVGLGHRRLAIIDLTDDGAQPMTEAETGAVIVFNGEIYNYLELREELGAKGYAFRSQSDTEVILAAYREWGPDCVRRFNGMWAFAIHDPAHKTVFCSRDRFGVKPFYFVDRPDVFAFGSEIRQLLPFVDRRVANRDVLTDYLCFGIDEIGVDTFFEGIRRLPPSHNLMFDVQAGTYRITRYYAVEQTAVAELSLDDMAARVRDLFTDSVRLRLRSDVRVGTCLSGGLDSSSVAAVASELNERNGGPQFCAITAASASPHNDESAYAQMVVDQSDLDWRRIRPEYPEFAAQLAEVVRAQEEPFLSPSVCMQFFVMQEAKTQGLRVLLDGQGGDETLLGYERHNATHLRTVYRERGLRATLRAIRDHARIVNSSPARQIFAAAAFASAPARWLSHRRRMPGAAHFPPISYFARRHNRPVTTVFDLQRREVQEESIPHLLRYEDKNAMWHAVETRLPFLDYRLVEYALNLPVDAKIHEGWTKFALRRAMEGLLPDAIAWRRTKLGFEAPNNLWLPALRPRMLEAVAGSMIFREFFGERAGRAAAERLPQNTLWRFYVAALWEREFGVSSVSAGSAA